MPTSSLYLKLRYIHSAIVILVSVTGAGIRLDLNIKVRNLRDIPRFAAILKNSLKNFAGEARGAYPASKEGFGALASI